MCVLLPLVLVLVPTWEHKWQAAFKQACCTFEICLRDGFWCPVTALFLGGGMAIAIHNVVLDVHQRCELFTALLLQDNLGSELELGGSWAQGSCPWRRLEMSSCCWVVPEGRQLGQWGRAELWCHVLPSTAGRETPGKAQNLAVPRILPTERGLGGVSAKRFEICGWKVLGRSYLS